MPDEFDFSAMLRQAQVLQEKFKQLQIEAAEKTVEAQSGGGMVRVVVDGAMRVRKIDIDPSIAAANDKAMMEDLIVVAVNDGLRRAQELVAEEMGKLAPMGGMNLPPGIFGGGADSIAARIGGHRKRWRKTISSAPTACRPR